MSKYIVKLEFEKDPSQLLKALGLRTSAFKKVKENILTRIIGNPQIEVIVLEFNRGGMFYGELTDTESYREAQKVRSNAARSARRRNQDRLEESEASGNDGVFDSTPDKLGRTLEQLLRNQIAQ